MTKFLLKVTPALMLILRIILTAAGVLFFLALISQFSPNMAKNAQLKYLLRIEHVISQPIDPILKSIIPRINGFDATNLIKLILCLMLSGYFRGVSDRMRAHAQFLEQKNKLKQWLEVTKIPEENSLYQELEKKLHQISTTKDQKLAHQLNLEFMEIKYKLESRSRYLAFLSIDVVDSTGMKTEEDKSMIQLDFLRFKKMVQKTLDKFGCVKSAWTPDGAMVCFNTVESAVGAAKECLFGLKRFNSQVKQISRDFEIRCGIHAGTIYYDEEMPLEEITDQVIDIAGHMQKHAKPGTIAISKQSIKPVDDPAGFKDLGKTVDDMEVFGWSIE